MSTRPETGIMKFEGDWAGVFIRGDEAMILAMELESLGVDPDADGGPLCRLRHLITQATGGRAPKVFQRLRPWGDCIDAGPGGAGEGRQFGKAPTNRLTG